jgi:hypothetical protein
MLAAYRNRRGEPAIFRVACPACSQVLKAPPQAVGKTVKCVCGHQFVLRNGPNATPAGPETRSGKTKTFVPTPTMRRRNTNKALVTFILAGTAVFLFCDPLRLLLRLVIPLPKPIAAAETPAATHSDFGDANDASPAGSRGPAEEKAALLRAAEQRLLALKDTYRRAKRQLLIQSLEHFAPPEFDACIPDFIDGKPVADKIESVMAKAAEADRNLSADKQRDKLEERTQRKEQFLRMLKAFREQIDDPNSEVSRTVANGLESFNTTKQLREQERLIVPLRQEVQALQSTGQ